MKFMVTRTSSSFDDDQAPCAGAVLETYTRLDVRTVSDPSQLKAAWDRDNWYLKGGNHRVESGKIVRDFDDQAWFIEVADLDALLAFYHKHGSIVLTSRYDNPTMIQLEIYDDYRE